MSTKDHLNFNKIGTHSIDGNFMKKNPGPWRNHLGETNLHSTNIKFTENPLEFCETNLLNVYL